MLLLLEKSLEEVAMTLEGVYGKPVSLLVLVQSWMAMVVQVSALTLPASHLEQQWHF